MNIQINHAAYLYLRYIKGIKTVKALISFAAKRNKGKIFILDIVNNKNILVDELNENANKVANSLMNKGVKKGTRALVKTNNRQQFIEVLLAAYKMGLEITGLSQDMAVEDNSEALNKLNCKVYFFDEETDIAHIRNTTAIEIFINLNCEKAYEGSYQYDEWLSKGNGNEPIVKVYEEDTALICFTSGTTGQSKIFLQSNRSIVYSFYNILRNNIGGQKQDIFLHTLPFTSSGFLTMIPSFVGGISNIYMDKFDAENAAELIEKHSITRMLMVPSYLIDLWDFYKSSQRKYDFSSLDTIYIGSAHMSAVKLKLIISDLGAKIEQGYGMSEALAPITLLRINNVELQESLLNSVGKPVKQVKVRIDEKAADGVGRICIKSKTILKYYLDRPDLNRDQLLADGWFRTNDMGYFDAEGYLYLVDRKDDVFMKNDTVIYPNLVEECMHKHAAVKEVTVVFTNDQIIAHISLRRGYSASEQEIIDLCRYDLNDYEVPDQVVFHKELPHSSGGKILRRELCV